MSMNRYLFTEKFHGVTVNDIVSDLPKSTVNALFTIWEGRGCVGRFSDFLKLKKPDNFVLDMNEVPSQQVRVG